MMMMHIPPFDDGCVLLGGAAELIARERNDATADDIMGTFKRAIFTGSPRARLSACGVWAHVVSGTVAGIARELIVTGIAGAENKALTDRLLLIERRLVVLEGLARSAAERSERIDARAREQRGRPSARSS